MFARPSLPARKQSRRGRALQIYGIIWISHSFLSRKINICVYVGADRRISPNVRRQTNYNQRICQKKAIPPLLPSFRLCRQHDGSHIVKAAVAQVIGSNQEIEYAPIHEIKTEIIALVRINL